MCNCSQQKKFTGKIKVMYVGAINATIFGKVSHKNYGYHLRGSVLEIDKNDVGGAMALFVCPVHKIPFVVQDNDVKCPKCNEAPVTPTQAQLFVASELPEEIELSDLGFKRYKPGSTLKDVAQRNPGEASKLWTRIAL